MEVANAYQMGVGLRQQVTRRIDELCERYNLTYSYYEEGPATFTFSLFIFEIDKVFEIFEELLKIPCIKEIETECENTQYSGRQPLITLHVTFCTNLFYTKLQYSEDDVKEWKHKIETVYKIAKTLAKYSFKYDGFELNVWPSTIEEIFELREILRKLKEELKLSSIFIQYEMLPTSIPIFIQYQESI